MQLAATGSIPRFRAPSTVGQFKLFRQPGGRQLDTGRVTKIKAALQREAEADHCSLASLAAKILAEWLRRRGALIPGSPKASRLRR
jgi:hypothetical protein